LGKENAGAADGAEGPLGPPPLPPEHMELQVLQGHDVFPKRVFVKLDGKLSQAYKGSCIEVFISCTQLKLMSVPAGIASVEPWYEKNPSHEFIAESSRT
jgi:hypothetical protein